MTTRTTFKDWWDDMIAWERGELDDEKTIELFQFLLDSGHSWTLQGWYGSFTMQLLDAGLIVEKDGQD